MSSPLPSPACADDATSSRQQQQRKQRTLHSSIEKRRRERINDKIQQLKEMIPACNPYSEKSPIAGPSLYQPLHKLTILQAAIEYIEEMHQKLLEAESSSSFLVDDAKVSKVVEHARQCAVRPDAYHRALE